MSDPTAIPFAESIWAKVPVWMTRVNGRKFLIAMLLLCDVGVQTLLEALYARFPGIGTPTALPFLGRDRGMLRGMVETDASFAGRLILWIDRWYAAGSQRAIARAIQEYCTGAPQVRVVNRAGVMTTMLASAGGFVPQTVTWNWDGASHPHRSGFWSEIWIIVYSPPWAISGPMGTTTPGSGIGQLCPRVDVDAITSLISSWKSAHTFVRAVLWAYDATLFNPASSPTMPDGTWGDWTYGGSLSGLGVLCLANKLRVWEPERDPNVGGPWT